VGGETNQPRTQIEYLLGKEVSRSYVVLLTGARREIRCVAAGSAWNDTNNLVTATRYYTNGAFAGLLWSLAAPDGTLTLYEYATNSTTRTNTIWQGQPNTNNTAVLDGSKSVTVAGQAGEMISETESDIASGIVLRQETYSNYDEFKRPQRVTHLDGTFADTQYGCCGIDSFTDRDGATTSYTYDALGRKETEQRYGVITHFAYDAAGNVTEVTRTGTNGVASTLKGMGYDLAGQLTAETNALSGVTTHAYSFDSGNGTRVVTTTYADGGMRIENYYVDGQLAKVTGTATSPIRYEYGVEQDGSTWRSYTKEIKLDANYNDTSEWTKTYVDMLGRSYKTVFAASATPYPYRQSFFNNKGQLGKERDPDGIVTLCAYNARGERDYTVVDLNQNDAIDWGGTDRITWITNDVTTYSGANVRRSRTIVYTNDNAPWWSPTR
jgi:YD repeat-containing protein